MLRPSAINVVPLPDRELRITFKDGKTCIFDVSPYIKGDWYGRLADPTYFNMVSIDGYTVVWPDGQDLDPDEIYLCSQTDYHDGTEKGEKHMSTKCPYCGSTDIARYIYGMPAMDDEVRKDLENGKLIIAGCEIHPGKPMPTDHCNNCNKEFGEADL